MLAPCGLAVVRSRSADAELVQYTEGIGQLAAASNQPIVSGGARGVDQAAVRGALAAAGLGVVVLPNNLELAAMSRQHRSPAMDGRLLLLSSFDPNARFLAWSALRRNKVNYVLGRSSLGVHSAQGRVDAWAGCHGALGPDSARPGLCAVNGRSGSGSRWTLRPRRFALAESKRSRRLHCSPERRHLRCRSGRPSGNAALLIARGTRIDRAAGCSDRSAASSSRSALRCASSLAEPSPAMCNST